MFKSAELHYLITSVDLRPVNNTQEARSKAFMLSKLSDLLDAAVIEEQKEDKEVEKTPPKKKAVRKKAPRKE